MKTTLTIESCLRKLIDYKPVFLKKRDLSDAELQRAFELGWKFWFGYVHEPEIDGKYHRLYKCVLKRT